MSAKWMKRVLGAVMAGVLCCRGGDVPVDTAAFTDDDTVVFLTFDGEYADGVNPLTSTCLRNAATGTCARQPTLRRVQRSLGRGPHYGESAARGEVPAPRVGFNLVHSFHKFCFISYETEECAIICS